VPRLTGFENHQGVTRLGPGVAPLAKVVTGVGNGDGTEGVCADRVSGGRLDVIANYTAFQQIRVFLGRAA